ncbi:MAG TPA: acyl-CoA reductase, partial [Cyclobacteriaceae bacterium]|nr:acyl-CoA reductase [Cyclobacteriaceae bacterium]
MAKTEILRSFVQLGENIRTNINRDELIQSALNENAWFTRQSIEKAFEGLSNYLNADKLEQWSSSYPFTKNTQKIGLVMAGNIPFVGFHDLLSVLVSGHKAVVKLSSDDRVLMRWVIEELIAINPQLQHRIFITDLLKDIEAVIATGSNNTARYFDYYFSKYPHIIRKNRNAVAVLDGT